MPPRRFWPVDAACIRTSIFVLQITVVPAHEDAMCTSYTHSRGYSQRCCIARDNTFKRTNCDSGRQRERSFVCWPEYLDFPLLAVSSGTRLLRNRFRELDQGLCATALTRVLGLREEKSGAHTSSESMGDARIRTSPAAARATRIVFPRSAGSVSRATLFVETWT